MEHGKNWGDNMAEKVTLKDATTGGTIYPKTLIDAVQNSDGQSVAELTLLKDNTAAFTPTGDYQPATKKYVDDNSGTNVVVSASQPTGLSVGDYWYEVT